MTRDDNDEIAREFGNVVNMTPSQLEKWLASDESKSVGYADGGNKSDAGGKEAVGHASGRRIIDDKRADNFLASVQLASIRIWLRANKSMT